MSDKMMGFGGYGYGGSYMSPSSSNLSASAPPFTLDRSPILCSVPLVDSMEPSYSGGMNSSLYNWLLAGDPTFVLNPAPSPNNAYVYGGLQTLESSRTIVSASSDPFGYSQSSNSVTKPYHPSYLSPVTQNDGPSIPDLPSYDWSSTSRVSAALDSSTQRSLDSSCGAELGDGLWSGFVEWKRGKQGQVSFSSKETDVVVPSMYENYMNPEAKIPKGLSRGEEASHGVDFLGMEKHGGSFIAEKLDENAFLGKTSSYMHVDNSRSVLESLSELAETQLQSPSVVFGTSSADYQLTYGALSEQHLKQHASDYISILNPSAALVICPPATGSGPFAPSNAPIKIVNSGNDVKDFHSHSISGNKPVFDSSKLRMLLERDDPTALRAILTKTGEMTKKECTTNDTVHEALKEKTGLSMDLNINEIVNSVQESCEDVDDYNHAVDSPCWKGVPVTHSSPLDASEVVPELKKLEAYKYSNFQEKQAFQLITDDKVYSEAGFLGHGSELPLNASPVAYSSVGEQTSEVATNVGHHSVTKVAQHCDDNHDYGSWSIGCSDTKSSQITKQNLQGGEATSKIMKESLKCDSSNLHIPLEHFTSSSSVDDTSCTKLNTSNEGASTPALDVPGFVSTIHNLSEFLLYHCTRGSSKLKQKDVLAVQSVINNLGVCISNSAEKTVLIQEPTISGKDYDYLGDLHTDYIVGRCRVTKNAGLIQALHDASNARERQKLHTSAKDDEILDSLSARGDPDMVDEDKTTQAFKKVLTENFSEEKQPQALLYKNLWLEAEAALCSINYKARYNRVKIEMENSKLLKSKDAHENTITADMKKPLVSLVSPDVNASKTLPPKDEGCPATKVQGSSALSPSSDDNDVMTRFQILKCQIENSNYSTPANVDKPSSSMSTPHSDNVAKILHEVHEEKANPTPETFIQISSDSGTNKDVNDHDSSVMARFRILKSRADTEVQQQPAETKLPRFASRRRYWPVIGSIPEFGSSGVIETNEDHFSGREFGVLVEDDTQAQYHSAYRPDDSGHDRVSSDWEHIRKEDLGWQNVEPFL